MKARKVKHLDPDGTLADNAQRVVAVRIDELYDFVPAVLDPKRVKKLHAMRIAAKRLLRARSHLLSLLWPIRIDGYQACA